jgi:hypothetical protein
MKKKTIRLVLSSSIILLTLCGLVYYISKHKNLLTRLTHTPPDIVVLILFLYGAWLYMCRKPVGISDNLLLNAYSLFANFFIPGQAGPALRGVYLKRRYNVRYRDYIYGMLLYYFFYGVVSVALLLAGSRVWWQTAIALVITIGVGVVCFNIYTKKLKAKGSTPFGLQGSAFLLAATLFQALIQVIIYFTEVHSVSHHVALHQVITYTGAANLALFVGLTPGAIGIRESFLVLTERLHHIGSSIIIQANIIDRAVYLVFLGILFLLILSMHANKKLQVSLQQSASEELEAKLLP